MTEKTSSKTTFRLPFELARILGAAQEEREADEPAASEGELAGHAAPAVRRRRRQRVLRKI